MEAREAKRLRKATFGKLCPHKAIEKEFESGIGLGVMVCTTCGTEFINNKAWAKIRENRVRNSFPFQNPL